MGHDNIVEGNQTSGTSVAVIIDVDFAGTLVRDNACTGDCETLLVNLSDAGP